MVGLQCSILECVPGVLLLTLSDAGAPPAGPETKGTVLIKSAAELESYSRSEEEALEKYIKGIADSGERRGCEGWGRGLMVQHRRACSAQARWRAARVC